MELIGNMTGESKFSTANQLQAVKEKRSEVKKPRMTTMMLN